MAERKMPAIEDYPSASIASEQEEKKDIIKVRKRKSVLKEIKGEFISEDAPTVGSYILYDILLPALRDLISDIGHGAIDMAMGTDGRRYRGRSRRDDRTYISYDRYWDRESPRRRSRWSDDDEDDDYYRERRKRKRGVPTNEDLDDFIFRTKDDAKDMLRKLRNRIDRYGDVSVAWYLDQMGETLAGDFTNEDWGWYNLDDDHVELKPAYGGGWRIIFPKIRPI